MVKKSLSLAIILLGLVLMSTGFASAALSTSITINDTDTFYSSYGGNDVVNLLALVNNDSEIAAKYANFSNFSTSCGTGGIVNFAAVNVTTYSASCNVSDVAANSNFAPGIITAVFAQGNGQGAENVSITSAGQIPVVVLYNMTTPPSPPASSCTRFGPLTTNFTRVLDFAHVNFVVNIQANFTCLAPPQAQVTASAFRDVMILNLTSLNLSTPSQSQKLSLLQSALNVTLVAPHKNGKARIDINDTIFQELNTNASIKFFFLPFTRLPAIVPDNPAKLNSTGFVANGYDSELKIATVNLTINVTGFSGDDILDNETPIITIHSPATSATSAVTSYNVSVNGTAGEPKSITITLNGTTYIYNETYNSANCTNISSDKETFNCYSSIVPIPQGTYPMTVVAYDFGEGLGNTNTTSTSVVVDTGKPSVYITTPANGTITNSRDVTFVFNVTDTFADTANLYPDCNLYLDVPADGVSFNVSSIDMSATAVNISVIRNIANGLHNFSVECFDGHSNTNSSETVYFTVDTIAPNVAITYPTGINYSTSISALNYTATSGAASCWYSTNLGATNVSNTCGTNVTGLTAAEGSNTWIVYANDSAGNVNSSSVTFRKDTTGPVITTVSPVNNSVYYINQSISVYFSASDASTYVSRLWYSNETTNSSFSSTNPLSAVINFTTTGLKNITFYANDSLNNITVRIITINITALSSDSAIVNDTTYNVNSTTANVVVPYNSTLQNVTLTNTSQIVTLDLSQSLSNGNVTLGGNNFTLQNQGTYNYTAFIPSGTTVIGGTGWDGKIIIPIVNSTTFTAPSSGTTNVVIEMGSAGELNFSQAVKIVIGGMAGKKAAWSRGSATLTAISTVCDSATAPTNIDAVTTRECYKDSGSDLVIWTYHFTSFAAYTAATATNATTDSSSSGGATAAPYWKVTYVADESISTTGYNKNVAEKERIKFRVGNADHYAGVVALTTLTATINVSSTPQQAVFNIGDIKKFDVNEDGYYDIQVTLKGIASSKADITLLLINEKIPAGATTTAPTNQTASKTTTGAVGTAIKQIAETVKKSSTGRAVFWIILVVILAVIALVVVRFIRKRQ